MSKDLVASRPLKRSKADNYPSEGKQKRCFVSTVVKWLAMTASFLMPHCKEAIGIGREIGAHASEARFQP